tara:strand:+ start:1680 stop:4544 length:2865 start_codon:yes stop_codon:yes gene_type:complete
MKYENFEPIRNNWPELYKHASLAEKYVHEDPATATIKLRCFAEALVGLIYRELELPSESGDGLFEMLKSEHFESVVESLIRQKLHAIRCYGNKAAHGNEVSVEQAIQLLKEAYFLSRWIFSTYSKDANEHYPAFIIPTPTGVVETNLKSENERLLQQLEEAKRELQRVQSAERQNFVLRPSLNDARLSDFRKASFNASSRIDFEEDNTRRLLKIEDSFAEYTLTNGQSELVKQLGKFLASNTENTFLLRGYAGTGKTFITKGLTQYFSSISRNYVLAAPTGKAAKVIQEKTKSIASTLHKTIYSFKNIAEYKDEDLDGSETYKFYAELGVNELPADTVYIVDEASMVSDAYSEAEFFRFGSGYLLKDFLKYVNLDHNDHRKKVIFIGDDAQLPPVGMSFSPALDEEYLRVKYNLKTTSYELTEVVRQKADSGIMVNCVMLRNALKKGVFNQLAIDFLLPDVDIVEHSNLIECYLDSCKHKINGESIVIAHSNADVAAYNRRIREYFFPGCPYITVHDKVMATSNSNAYGFFISNGDFGVVKKVLSDTEDRTVTLKRKQRDTGEVLNIKVQLAFKDVIVGFRDLDGKAQFFEAKIIENLLYSDQPSLSSDENKALYLDFCIRHPHLHRGSLEFKDTLMSDPYFNALKLKFGYAITCHKAQGSEWNNVFVKCKTSDNQRTPTFFRWFYTAITRASKKLWLLDPPSIKIGDGIKPIHKLNINSPPSATSIDSSLSEQNTELNIENPFITDFNARLTEESASEEQVAIKDISNGQFGIPEDAKFLLGIFHRVNKLIADHDIIIEGIVHQQYQEAYTFRYGSNYARLDIGYNSKGKITRVTAPTPTALSSEVKNLLASMIGVPIVAGVAVQVSFDEDFLNDFHQRLLPLAHGQSISIQNVEKYPWHLRYSFTRGTDIAVCDIYFNGKKSFTRYQPLITACSPGQLLHDVEILLTQGLSA